MGRTVRQVSDSQVTDYSYDLSGQTLTEYTETDEQAGRLIVHVIDENGQETATLKNPVWDSASAAYTIGEDTICETAGYDLAGNLTRRTVREIQPGIPMMP